MKKILMASTMLVATGGMAAADITFDGFGRFGIDYNESRGSDVSASRLDQRFRLNIVGTAETDGGIEFRARLRIESNDNSLGQGEGGDSNEAPEFGVRAGGFNLFLGNTSDLIDSGDIVDYYGNGIGLTDFAETSSGFGLPINGIGPDDDVDPTIKTSYTVGGLTVGASYSDNASDDSTDEYQIGAGYKFGNYGIGIVGGNVDDGTDDADFVAASFNGDLGSFAFSLLVADIDVDGRDTAYGASVAVPVGAATDIRFVVSDNGADDNEVAYAVGFRHSLGGGVRLQGGIGENSDGRAQGDLGVIFNF